MANNPRETRSLEKRTPQIEGNPVRNEILVGLPSPECDVILSQFTSVELRTRDVLEESDEIIKYAYFPNSGLISFLTLMSNGKVIEVGLSGKEGCTALPVAAGLRTSSLQVVVQASGTAFRVNVPTLIRLLKQCPTLQKRMQQQSHIMSMQAAHVAACNRLHEVDERMARWLLMSQDRLGTDVIPLTHEFLAHMLGTRRSSVTVAAGLLARAGLISYNRGEVKINDRARLEDASCECYELINRHLAAWKREFI